MSRGLGKVERAILEMLDKVPAHQCTLAGLLWLIEPKSPDALMMGAMATDSPNYSSYKRAVRSLREKGYIVTRSTAKECWIKRTSPTGTLTELSE